MQLYINLSVILARLEGQRDMCEPVLLKCVSHRTLFCSQSSLCQIKHVKHQKNNTRIFFPKTQPTLL